MLSKRQNQGLVTVDSFDLRFAAVAVCDYLNFSFFALRSKSGPPQFVIVCYLYFCVIFLPAVLEYITQKKDQTNNFSTYIQR
jgi:hypothetical protein